MNPTGFGTNKKAVRKIFTVLFSFLSFLIFVRCISFSYVYADSDWIPTSLNSRFVTSVEQSPWGILAGELDTRQWLIPPPTNAVYLSRDLGKTWEVLGLQHRGVRDIKYYDGKIYASTYLEEGNTVGLFVSNNKGATWSHIGPPFVSTEVDRDSKAIYLGEENYGLWVSQDEGQTWTQKVGVTGDGVGVKNVKSSEKITFAATRDKVYKTTNNGTSWTEVTALTNKGIAYFYINGDIILAGSAGTVGIFLSTDGGNTWHKLDSFGNYAVGNITYYNKRYYVGRLNPQKQVYTVYSTSDLGNTWTDTNLNSTSFDRTLELAPVFSEPEYLFAVVLSEGIFKLQIPKKDFIRLPLFNIPWQTQNENELIDKITSYFDHSYPMLGYNYFSEPQEENSSTLNFLGYKNFEPYIYYSSHSGIDFGLKFGTEIVAPAAGYTSYYYCSACGNTIKIDHLNGYQSIYMHLQDNGLITKNGLKWVNIGDKIGQVGMTGRTTGPHLHFEVTKDLNANGNFLDDFPSGRVDPFGWQDFKNEDPWKSFSWTDLLGNHHGSESVYLWKSVNDRIAEFISSESEPTVSLANKSLSFKNVAKFFTSKITGYIQPILTYSQNSLKYIENTSFVAEAFDQLGGEIKTFDNLVDIEISLDPNTLGNLILSSIRLYFWNEATKLWEILPSFYDSETHKLTAQTEHFSWFAAFGEKLDANSPETDISVSGSQNGSWFTEFPLVELNPYDGENSLIDGTFYSINNGEIWEAYTQPFFIQKDGITDLLFKSQDVYENVEDTKNYILQVNTSGKQTFKARVLGSKFETTY